MVDTFRLKVKPGNFEDAKFKFKGYDYFASCRNYKDGIFIQVYEV